MSREVLAAILEAKKAAPLPTSAPGSLVAGSLEPALTLALYCMRQLFGNNKMQTGHLYHFFCCLSNV